MLLLLLSIALTLGLAYLAHRHARLLRYIVQYVRMQYRLRRFLWRGHTVADEFAERVRRSPHAPAILFEGRTYSYAALDRRSSRVAEWALSVGLHPRDKVALLHDNTADFVITWLGLAKVGVCTALIPTGLKHDALTHALQVSEARMVIVSAGGDSSSSSSSECADAFAAVRGDLPPTVQVWMTYEDAHVATSPPTSDNLSLMLARMPDQQRDYRALRLAAKLAPTDLLFLIFTSGQRMRD